MQLCDKQITLLSLLFYSPPCLFLPHSTQILSSETCPATWTLNALSSLAEVEVSGPQSCSIWTCLCIVPDMV